MIVGGAPADVAILSNEQHAVWLHINDGVETDWHTFPYQGIISRSPIVIAVRPGNPLGIMAWADLPRPGMRLVHPDPRTSGGARWALLAEYGSALLEENGSPQRPVSSYTFCKRHLTFYERDALSRRGMAVS